MSIIIDEKASCNKRPAYWIGKIRVPHVSAQLDARNHKCKAK